MRRLVDDYEQKVKVFNEQLGKTFQKYYEHEINGALVLMRETRERLDNPKGKT